MLGISDTLCVRFGHGVLLPSPVALLTPAGFSENPSLYDSVAGVVLIRRASRTAAQVTGRSPSAPRPAALVLPLDVQFLAHLGQAGNHRRAERRLQSVDRDV